MGSEEYFLWRVRLVPFWVAATLPGASSDGGLGPPWPRGERRRRRSPEGRRGKRHSGGKRGLARGGEGGGGGGGGRH